MGYLRLLEVREMGLHKVSREQGWYHPGGKFLPPHLRNFKPQPLCTLGFVRVFPKFIICLDVLLGYEKAGGCGLFLLSTELKAG